MSAPSGPRFKDLAPRVSTAAIYASATIGAVWWGALPTAVLYGVIAALATREFYTMRRGGPGLPHVVLGVAAAGVMPIATAFWAGEGIRWVFTVLTLVLIVRHTFIVRVRVTETAEALFGALYAGVLISHLVLIRSVFADGMALTLVLLASVWASDVAAYLFGIMFGRHKLAPRISPKKSWEGFYAGTAACVAVWVLLPGVLGVVIAPWLLGVVGLTVALAAVVGDLFESRLKREVGVKDSGDSLPGHGGFLDRIDSLLLAGLVAYWALWLGGIR